MSAHVQRAAVVVGAAILVLVHVLALHHVASHLAVPAGATLLVVGMVVLKHTRVLTVLRDRFHRR